MWEGGMEEEVDKAQAAGCMYVCVNAAHRSQKAGAGRRREGRETEKERY